MSRLALVVLISAVAACAPRVTTRVIGESFPPRPESAEVEVFSVKLPDCPFEEIALVTVLPQVRLGPTPRNEVLNALRARTRELGGHAVVGVRELLAKEGSGLRDGVQGTAVRYLDPAACEGLTT